MPAILFWIGLIALGGEVVRLLRFIALWHDGLREPYDATKGQLALPFLFLFSAAVAKYLGY